MFKVSKNVAPPHMHDIFKLKDQPHYNLRYNSLFSGPLVKSVYKVPKSFSFSGPKIWDILPDTYKDMPDLNSFKVALKKCHSLTIVHFFGCAIVARLVIKSIDFMKDV